MVRDENSARPATMDGIAFVRTAICRALQGLERTVETMIGPRLSAGPYFGLLLDIYLAEMEGKTVFQSSLSTDAVASKPHRRSVRLAELGALTREPDPRDRRRTDLRLTPATKSALDRTMDLVQTLFPAQGGEFGQLSDRPPELKRSERMWYAFGHGNDNGQAALTVTRGKVIGNGGIALPADISRALGLRNGDTVLFDLDGDEVRIRPARSALPRVQGRPRTFAPKRNFVSERLIDKRLDEANNA